MSKDKPTYLNVKETAELLRVKPRTVYDWVSNRKIPFERKGGSVRFRLDALEKWNTDKHKASSTI